MYNYLFLDLGEKFYAQTKSFTAGARQSVSCLIWHVLLRSCYLLTFIFFVINLSLGLCFKSAAWKPHHDIWNYSRLGEYRRRGNQTGRYLSLLHTRTRIPELFVLVTDPASTWKTAFSEPLPTSYQSFLLADNERPRVFLARRLLVNWDGDGVLVAQGQVPIW